MLFLTRDPDQRIIINGNIIVKYLGINEWGQAKFGIDAPDSVNIVRKELLTQKKHLPPESVSKPVIKYRKARLRMDLKT